MEKHQGGGIDVVERFEVGKPDAEPVEEADRVGPPRDVLVEEEGADDEETGDMVDEEGFLADGVTSINYILDGHFVDVECAAEEEEDTGKVIRP